jgi:hypothetical protein
MSEPKEKTIFVITTMRYTVPINSGMTRILDIEKEARVVVGSHAYVYSISSRGILDKKKSFITSNEG